jgi:sugar phosphate isomerase/epimerase
MELFMFRLCLEDHGSRGCETIASAIVGSGRWFRRVVPAAALLAVLVQSPMGSLADQASTHPVAVGEPQRYRIAVCDWMILKRQKLGAFELARAIGADGLELDLGSLGPRVTLANALTNTAVRQQFLDEAAKQQVGISSMAMSAFYVHSFSDRSNACEMALECIQTMKQMGVKTAFLPLLGESDMALDGNGKRRIVDRLKTIAPQAEAAGVVIGLETTLDAKEQIKLLEDLGSPAFKAYVNFANVLQAGRDLPAELRLLGKDRICMIHCTDSDGVWLQENTRLDLHKVKQTLDEMGWSGWLVVERSRRLEYLRDVRKNFSTNVLYLKSVFQAH